MVSSVEEGDCNKLTGMRGGYHSRAILGQLRLRLVNPLGEEVHVAVSPKTYFRKNKRTKNDRKRLKCSINHGANITRSDGARHTVQMKVLFECESVREVEEEEGG